MQNSKIRFIISGIITLTIMLNLSCQAQEESVVTEKNNIVVLDISGSYSERPDTNSISLDGISTHTFPALLATLQKIAGDDEIDGIMFNFEDAALSRVQVDVLGRELVKLREAQKKTYAYIETVSQTTYMLACQCDEVAITPTGDVQLSGLAGQMLYFKNLLDKVGVKADFLHMGDYKGAAEPLTLTGPSDAEIEQYNRLFDHMYAQMLSTIAYGRDLPEDQVSTTIDQGPFTATEAKDARLVDEVMYRKDFLLKIKEQTGQQIILHKDYDKPEAPEINLDNPFALITNLQTLFDGPKDPEGDAIAIVYVEGTINTGSSQDGFSGQSVGSRTIRKTLADARRNPDIKAVVIRVDSPGGSATASDIIYNAIQETAMVKPVIVSMGTVAASGGYYISCGCDTIFAEKATVTGSIGVVGGKMVIDELLNKIGITTYTFKRGKNSGMYSSTEPFSRSERRKFRTSMASIYDIFKCRVESTRKAKLKRNIESLAQGKVYTGDEALELGLIDKIGGLQEAIDFAAGKANLNSDDYHLRHLPKPKTIFEMLDEMFAATGSNNGNYATISGQTMGIVNLLAQADPSLKKSLTHAMNMIEMVQQQQIMLIMPYDIIVR
ncbi:MAG: signal peptide peptidase SppA [Phycisphaerae bacterium]|nr:signal peptide peptidase SppA [Phycisphaerae bacterium]